MKSVLGGTFANQIICRDHNYRSEKEEEFYQISVNVRGMDNLEKSLEAYVQVGGRACQWQDSCVVGRRDGPGFGGSRAPVPFNEAF